MYRRSKFEVRWPSCYRGDLTQRRLQQVRFMVQPEINMADENQQASLTMK